MAKHQARSQTKMSSPTTAQKQVNEPVEEQAAAYQPRPYSTRDYIYEAIQRVSIERFEGSSTGHDMNEGERELTLIPMVASIQTEVETLRAEGAKGDMAAVESLHRIAFESTRQLALLTDSSPELVSHIAEQEAVWPVLYSDLGIHKSSAAELVSAIKLGTKLTGALEPSNALSVNTTARQLLSIVAGSMKRIRDEARKQEQHQDELAEVNAFMRSINLCPPPGAVEEAHFEDLKSAVMDPGDVVQLSVLLKVKEPFKNPDTLGNLVHGSKRLPELAPDEHVVKAWMNVIKQFLMDVCEGHPEKSALRTMGIYQAESASTSYESNVRSGIWVRLESALKSIAAQKPHE